MGRRFGLRGGSIACVVFVSLLLTLTSVFGDTPKSTDQTALDRYVAAPDPTYAYKLVRTIPGEGYTLSVLRMTSQTWLTPQEVDHPVWEHWMTVIRPTTVKSSKALLFIGGGSRNNKEPQKADRMLTTIAVATNSVVAELRSVPNQPLVFAGETEGRTEDALIAYTWDHYLRTGDERWPARLPMSKSAVRAMDTVTDFCAKSEGGGVKVDSFVVAGASKRGWTTWTTGAVDKRVVAVIPIVIDTLNVQKTGAHHYSAYGFFAPSLQDYVDMKIPQWFNTPQYKALLKIEEPYEYRQRLTMPKFIINATGDQYFPPDNSQFYFADLPGEKYLRYVPNADHSLNGSDAAETLLACYRAVVRGAAMPKFSWSMPDAGTIRGEAKDKPKEAKLWQATNPAARDFRLETIGKAWTSKSLDANGSGVYEAKVEKPAKGWTAFFIELTYDAPGGDPPVPLKLTTQVSVVPDVLPFKFPPAEQSK
jgi:PhoPQ-activated pathogenicity-related protein